MRRRQPPRAGLVAVALVVVDGAIRLVAGGPYLGATFVLLAACGVSLLPLLPGELGTPSLRLAVLPALAIGSFAILLTSVSLVGVPLGELSIRLSVAVLVVVLGVVAAVIGSGSGATVESSRAREGLAVAALAGIVGLSLAASWEVVDPYPPPGTDWATYLLYADEVEAQNHLLIDNPFAVGEARVLGYYPGIGALYGSLRILDGVSSSSLAYGLVAVMALTPLAVFGAVAALWGLPAGVVAASIYAVSAIHLEPLYWHGLGTTLALVFLPLAILALGLLQRGSRDPRTVILLGFSLAALAAVHWVSAGVVGVVLAITVLADVVRGLAARRLSARVWWHEGTSLPALAGVGAGALLGAGVIVHQQLVAADSGPPVSYRFFDRDWLDGATADYYFSWLYLALFGVSAVVILLTRRLRNDPALLPVVALALTALLVSQAWRVHVPFEYRRVVYYLGVTMAIVIGLAAVRLLEWRRVALATYVVVFVALAQGSIGLRLPVRLFEEPPPRAATVDALADLRGDGASPQPVVSDRCLGPLVPYVVRAPTYAAVEEWQAGFEKGVPATRTARRLLAGGPEGRRLAQELGVRYAVVDPACTPEAAETLGGRVVVETADLVIVDLS